MAVDRVAVDRVALLAFLLRLLAARSASTAEEAAARVFADELAALGFDVGIDDWGNVVGTLRLGDGPTVLLDGHLDTVDAVAAEWSYSPWGELVDGIVHGRGAVDMKGALAAAAHGAATLRGHGRGTVVVSGSVCEELVEGAALDRVLERHSPDVVIIGEPSANRLMLGQRGRAEVVVETQGRTSHSAYPGTGVNAAEVMAELMRAIRSLEFPSDPLLGSGMICLTNLVSSPYPNVSVVPDRCTATYDRRTVLGEGVEDVLAPIRALVEPVAAAEGAGVRVCMTESGFTTWAGADVSARSFAPAWRTDPDRWPAQPAIGALTAAGFGLETGNYGFCTNGSASAGLRGIPTLGFGPGDPDRAHTVDERISVDDLNRGAAGYAALLRSLLA